MVWLGITLNFMAYRCLAARGVAYCRAGWIGEAGSKMQAEACIMSAANGAGDGMEAVCWLCCASCVTSKPHTV